MNTHARKEWQSPRTVVRSNARSAFATAHFTDHRPEAIAQRAWQGIAENSPRIKQLKVSQNLADQAGQRKKVVQLMGPEEEDLLQGKFQPLQRMGMPEEEDLLQGKFQPLQRMGTPEEEEPLQGKFEPVQRKENNTGLPDNLKSGIENLSGITMDDVQVHFNSDRPAPLQAHAFTQGTNIHVAPGQEKHLAHEAWHVVQQKQGRVQATMSLNGQAINDNPALEQEADQMGARALQFKTAQKTLQRKCSACEKEEAAQMKRKPGSSTASGMIQRACYAWSKKNCGGNRSKSKISSLHNAKTIYRQKSWSYDPTGNPCDGNDMTGHC